MLQAAHRSASLAARGLGCPSAHAMPMSTRIRRAIIAGSIAVTGVLMAWDLATPLSAPAWIFLVALSAALIYFVRRFPRLGSTPVPPETPEAATTLRVPALRELFRESLYLGVTGFGGGLAVLSQIELRLVSRHRWIRERLFLEAAALAQSLPGAIATNALTFIGYRLAGVSGALAALVGFVIPSFALLLIFALLYPYLRHLTAVQGLFSGLTPAVAGLVAATAVRIGGQAILDADGRPGGWRALWKDRWGFVVVVASFLGSSWLGLGVVEVILLAGLLGILREFAGWVERPLLDLGARWRWLRWRVRRVAREEGAKPEVPWWRRWTRGGGDFFALAPAVLMVAGPALASFPERLQSLGGLVGVFLRAGALTFGGGFVMIPLLEAELVEGHRWMSAQSFADAMALGQVTPGPVVITATFVGYRIAGLTGAILATAAVFLPAFLMLLVIGASVQRFRSNTAVQAFLHGIQPAVVGLMFSAAVVLLRHGVTNWVGVVIAALSFALLWRWRLAPAWVMLGGCLLGLITTLARV
ncbi:MAG: hypothetical protein A2W00_15195 [Candidatus Eisenbacteria bacterium RBG_16_71_46]|nr:MAG: hypothetical protein A2W00_15195 [Candidatus Eisenbacteria bacterium RBG_16_71_46]